MKKVEIFEPAMCCSTGVCGPSVDSELLRVTGMMDEIQKAPGVKAYRYNLKSNPQIFVTTEAVLKLMQEKGNDVLPITLLDGVVVKTGAYPLMSELKEQCELVAAETGEACCGGNCSCEAYIAEEEKAQLAAKAKSSTISEDAQTNVEDYVGVAEQKTCCGDGSQGGCC